MSDKREIWLAGAPGTLGGARSEALHLCDLLRAHDVAVKIVPLFDVDPEVVSYLQSIGCKFCEYHPKIFADRIVADFNCGLYALRLPEIMSAGAPRLTLHFPCMLVTHEIEQKCHYAGWFHRFGFVSDYQRRILSLDLGRIRPITEFLDYRPYLNPKNPLQRLDFLYSAIGHEYSIGRVSRDDPAKFSADTWQLFDGVDSGRRAKKVRILGFGARVSDALGPPPPDLRCDLLHAGAQRVGDFYKTLHCVIHKTGSSGESYCRVVPECYAAGVPFIGEKDYSLPEIVVDGVTGFLCESTAEMIAKANLLARDENVRREMIYAAREYLETTLCNAETCWKPWERLFAEN